ncbi:MAG: hypothetical protein R3253_15645, partial [Longimicrobiales bacterium]|nr:hypothetical protein [Longimicrobiales bacterium]
MSKLTVSPTTPARMALACVALVSLSGCATLQQIGALQNVDFMLQGVSDVRLAGVDFTRVRSFSDLSFADAARLASAVQNRDLPLELQLDVVATNPEDNYADARLVQMDWTLFLEDRETVSGVVDREISLPRGEPTAVPVRVGLNLVEFYEGNAQDLFELALALAGQGGEPKEVAVEALPTVQTSLGPIRYPNPLRLTYTVGGQ